MILGFEKLESLNSLSKTQHKGLLKSLEVLKDEKVQDSTGQKDLTITDVNLENLQYKDQVLGEVKEKARNIISEAIHD